MPPRNRALFNIDFILLSAMLALTVIGILFIYSSGVNSQGLLVSDEYLRQLVWAGFSLLAVGFLVFTDYNVFREFSWVLYGLILLLLVATLLWGRVVNGAQSWLGFGGLGGQPSEFAKIILVIVLARHYSNRSSSPQSLKHFFIGLALVLLPAALVLRQPDFGTALVYFPILLSIALVGGARVSHIIFVTLLAVFTLVLTSIPFYFERVLKQISPLSVALTDPVILGVVLGSLAFIWSLGLYGRYKLKIETFAIINYGALLLLLSLGAATLMRLVLKEYQIMRFVVFLDPSVDPLASGWNLIQSLTAVGSGGFWGKGFLQGTQSHLRYLPMQSTDFIFSILAEEWGFLGGVLVFALYGVILWRCLVIMLSARDQYGANLVAGVVGMVFFHLFLNVGMTIGMMPITGIPIYFLSYGGSHLMTGMLAFGLVLNVHYRRYLF